MCTIQTNSFIDLPTRIEQCEGALDAVRLGGFLGFKKSTIYEMAADGRIPHYRIGSAVRFDPHIIAEWLRSQAVPVAA
jgi:excisionase family DNA binding protein